MEWTTKLFGKIPVLGIDLGERSAKYVLVMRSGKDLVVDQFGVIDLKEKGQPVKDPMGKIRGALAAKGIKTFQTVVGVSGQSVFLRFVRLPPVPKKQMDQIVCYEAQQQVPFPIEEVRWDYQVLSAAAEEERDVVLVAVKNDILEQINRSFTESGLRPNLIDASVLAIVNCLAYNQIIHPGTSSLILDIGAKTTYMIVADRGALWIRNIPIAGNHLTQAIVEALDVDPEEAEQIKVGLSIGQAEIGFDNEMKQKLNNAVEKALGRLFGEVLRSLGFYRSQNPNATINDIYLCGSGTALRGLDQAAKERFNLPVKRLDSLAGFKVSSGISIAELNRSRPFLAGALGLALRLLRPCRLQIDLIPHDVRKQNVLLRRVAYVAATYLVLGFMGLSYWAYTSRLVGIQQLRTGVLDTSLRDMERLSRGVDHEHEQVQVLRMKFQKIEESLLSAQAWPEVLGAIAAALPNNFWLVKIHGEKNETAHVAARGAAPLWGLLVLEGKTSGDIDKDLPLFREALMKIPYLSDIEIQSAEVQNGLVEFSIKLKVKPPTLVGGPS